jgi:MerR family transcriptional regulator, mercuric resistance operon regulatory protein
MQKEMTIGRLAKAAGVNVETVRYYQRRGLIDEPAKPHGGQRRYPPSDLQKINFIKRAQQLGFSLAEVQDLLDLSDGKNHRETRAIAERKVQVIDSHIAHLAKTRSQLNRLIARSRKVNGRGFCPIIAAFAVPET